VKSRNIILSLFSVLLGLVFLAGSTGITLIIHNCAVCHDFSAVAGIYLSPEVPEDHCCEAAENHCTSGNETAMENSCCHFRVEKLSITGYAPAIPLIISAPAESPSAVEMFNNKILHEFIPLPPDLHNKHGGRCLLTYNCQFLT